MSATEHDRTKEEKFADRLDCELYRLVCRAANQKEKHWKQVAVLLAEVRPYIRARMHKKDREQTV